MITSRQNPLIKQLRKLRQGKGRREQGLLLFEGTNLVEAAVQQGYTLETFCYTEQWCNRHPELWEQVMGQAERSEIVSPDVIESIATTVSPDGAIAALPQSAIHAISPQQLSLGLMVERLQDPGNLGTILRTAAATRADGLWLSADSVDHYNPKVLRASAGAWFQVPVLRSPNLPETLHHWQQQGIQVVATTAQATKTYWMMDWKQPSLILLGNERAGLSPDLLDLADHQVCIPQSPLVESLNLGISAALLLYEVQRQRYNEKV